MFSDLYGSNAIEVLRIDMCLDTINELHDIALRVMFSPEDLKVNMKRVAGPGLSDSILFLGKIVAFFSFFIHLHFLNAPAGNMVAEVHGHSCHLLTRR